MDEIKERTLKFIAKREFLEKAFQPGFFHSNNEDIKTIGVCSIESLFSHVKLDENGTAEESTLARRHPHNFEGENLNEKIDKSGFGEVKTLTSDMPLFWITKTLIIIVVL